MFCSNCGNQVSDNAKFCNACGAPLQAAPAPVAAKPAIEVDEFGVPVAPKAAAIKTAVEVDEFGVPVTPKKVAKPAVEVDEFGVPVSPKTVAPKSVVEVDEFGVPVAANEVPAAEANAAPVVDEFGVPVNSGANATVRTAKPVNKKLLIGIGIAVIAAILVVVLIILLGGSGGKSSKMALIEASLDAMCDDPGDIMDYMPSKVIDHFGEGMSRSEMKDELRDNFSEYVGCTVKSCKIENEMSEELMVSQINKMLGSNFDEYCIAYCTVVFECDGDTEEVEFTFHMVREGGKWYLMYFEE